MQTGGGAPPASGTSLRIGGSGEARTEAKAMVARYDFNHVGISIPDLDAAIAWYRDFLLA